MFTYLQLIAEDPISRALAPLNPFVCLLANRVDMTLRRGGAVFASPESESVRMVEGLAVYTYTPGTQTDPFAVGGRKVILYQGLH